MWPHRQQPTRRPCPGDSPGKNTGVGCHFLPQCMKVKSESEVAQSCPTVRDPMDCSLPGSPIHGIFQARVLGVGCHCLLHINRWLWHNTFNGRNRLLMVYSEKQDNKETHVSKSSMVPFLPWKNARSFWNSTTILKGAEEMKIPRIWSLPERSLPTCGKKRVIWRGGTGEFIREGKNAYFGKSHFLGNFLICL